MSEGQEWESKSDDEKTQMSSLYHKHKSVICSDHPGVTISNCWVPLTTTYRSIAIMGSTYSVGMQPSEKTTIDHGHSAYVVITDMAYDCGSNTGFIGYLFHRRKEWCGM